jgi:hypothetical protein
VLERAKTVRALDRAATAIGDIAICVPSLVEIVPGVRELCPNIQTHTHTHTHTSIFWYSGEQCSLVGCGVLYADKCLPELHRNLQSSPTENKNSPTLKMEAQLPTKRRYLSARLRGPIFKKSSVFRTCFYLIDRFKKSFAIRKLTA